MTEQPTPLGLIAEQALHRELLSTALAQLSNVRFVAVAHDADELLRMSHNLGPRALTLVWCRQQRDWGLKTIRSLRRADFNLRTIALGIESNHEVIVRYLEAGAAGYLTLHEGFSALHDLIQNLRLNRTELCPSILTSVIARIQQLQAIRAIGLCDVDLSTRELQVLRLMAEGRMNKQIANRLAIEAPTVKNHVHHILCKLGARTRREAAHVAKGLGLLSPSPNGRSANCNVN